MAARHVRLPLQPMVEASYSAQAASMDSICSRIGRGSITTIQRVISLHCCQRHPCNRCGFQIHTLFASQTAHKLINLSLTTLIMEDASGVENFVNHVISRMAVKPASVPLQRIGLLAKVLSKTSILISSLQALLNA